MKGTASLGVASSRNTRTVTLGALSVEVNLLNLNKEVAGLGFSQYHKNPPHNSIGNLTVEWLDAKHTASAPCERSDIVKGKKMGDQLLLFSDEEIKAMATKHESKLRVDCVRDVQDIPAAFVRNTYAVAVKNATLGGMMFGALKRRNEEMMVGYVEGNVERSARLFWLDGKLVMQVLQFESEVAESPAQELPEASKYIETIDQIFSGFKNKPVPERMNTRNIILEDLLLKKSQEALTGVVAEPVVLPQRKEEMSIEQLLADSLKLAT